MTSRGWVSIDDRNYYVYPDGRVVEERIEWRWVRFRPFKNPDYVSWPYDVPVTDSETVRRVRAALLRKQNLGRTSFPPQKQLPPGPRHQRVRVDDVRGRRFTTPDGAEWQYSSEFGGHWVEFARVDGTKSVTGTQEPLSKLTNATLSEALLQLWQGRQAFNSTK